MSLIRSRGNRATELRLIALMRGHGITGWRRNARVFGKPGLHRTETVCTGFESYSGMRRRNRASCSATRVREAVVSVGMVSVFPVVGAPAGFTIVAPEPP